MKPREFISRVSNMFDFSTETWFLTEDEPSFKATNFLQLCSMIRHSDRGMGTVSTIEKNVSGYHYRLDTSETQGFTVLRATMKIGESSMVWTSAAVSWFSRSTDALAEHWYFDDLIPVEEIVSLLCYLVLRTTDQIE